MRIAIFTDGFPPYISGVATAVVKQTEYLAHLGHEIMVISPSPPVDIHSLKKLDRVRIHRMGLSLRWPFLPQLWLGIPTIIKSFVLVRRFRPDVIHLHMEGAAGLEGLFSGHLLKVPMVGTFSTLFANGDYLRSYRLPSGPFFQNLIWHYQKWFFNRCDLVITPSKGTRDLLRSRGFIRDIKVLSYGIEKIPEKYEFSSEALRRKYGCADSFNVLYVGRVSSEKSLEIVVAAFEKLCQNHSQLAFIIIGDGNYISHLKRLAGASSNRDSYLFLGAFPHDQLIELGLYRLGDVFVTASKTETEGIAMREAMASGLPVITVAANAALETVTHEYNGFLVTPDSSDEIEVLLEDLLKSPGVLSKMSENATRSVGANAIENVVKQVEQVYFSIAKPDGRASV